jgi:hypothetical protein
MTAIPFTIADDSPESIKGAWRHLIQQIERAERALSDHIAADTQEEHARTWKAVKHYDTLVCAAGQMLYQELQAEKNRVLGLTNAA